METAVHGGSVGADPFTGLEDQSVHGMGGRFAALCEGCGASVGVVPPRVVRGGAGVGHGLEREPIAAIAAVAVAVCVAVAAFVAVDLGAVACFEVVGVAVGLG